MMMAGKCTTKVIAGFVKIFNIHQNLNFVILRKFVTLVHYVYMNFLCDLHVLLQFRYNLNPIYNCDSCRTQNDQQIEPSGV